VARATGRRGGGGGGGPPLAQPISSESPPGRSDTLLASPTLASCSTELREDASDEEPSLKRSRSVMEAISSSSRRWLVLDAAGEPADALPLISFDII